MGKLADFLENNMMACGYKQNFGIECPGCGFQRSVISLLRGDIVHSFQQYPATIPMLLMFLFLIIHLFFKFRSGAKYLLILFIINISIIVINYLLKLLT